jgi:hypothetical protein
MVDPERREGKTVLPHETRTRVLDGDGLRWKVREDPWPTADRRAGTCLIFETDAIIRRVRNVPPGWFELSDVDLYALSLRP